MPSQPPLRVGLTGGIAAGKSAVAARLRELGAAVVDHDLLAREVVAAGTPGLAALVDAFGPGILTAGGELDRPALGARVFADPAERARLEAVVHPLVREAARRRGAELDGCDVVVHDIPLLVETGQADRFDEVVVVQAPEGVRVARLTGRGLTEAEARRRIAAQADDASRAAVADVLLDGGGTLADLHRQVDALWSRWHVRA